MPMSGAEKALGVLAAAGAVVVVLAVQQADRSADAGRQGSSVVSEQDAERDAQDAGARDRQLYADKVYLAEPSPEDARAHPPEPGTAGWLAVVNASGLQVEDVWVSDGAGRAISIRSAARCTMYALPADFDPEHLYFTGPNGRWHRPFGRDEVEVPLRAFPAPETDSGDPAWSGPVENCGA